MINYKFLKTLKRAATILLITVFSIVGIVACGGAEDIAGSRGGGYDNTGPVDTTDTNKEPEQPEQPTFSDNSYYKLYTLLPSGEEYKVVSSEDTNSLNQIWKDVISRKGADGNERFFIRDGDNRGENVLEGNYYYFDKNFDIVHAGKYADKVRLKEFIGGVIVKYSGGAEYLSGKTWTVGGLYKTVLNKEKNNSQGQQGYTKYNNDNLNEFMRAIHGWEEGDLSVILINTGYFFFGDREYGVDEYYCTVDDNYRKDPSYFIGVDPKTYLGTDIFGYWEEKLNVRVNHSWKTSEKYNFKFTVAEPYDWHLEQTITKQSKIVKFHFKN